MAPTELARHRHVNQERIPTQQLITRDYEGQQFLFREDGYFNMTKAAQQFGKQLQNFWVNAETKLYMEELTEVLAHRNSNDLELVQAVGGNRHMPNRGTWGHPKIAVFFARWLSPKFAVFCDMVIDDILNKKAELTITKPEESAVIAMGPVMMPNVVQELLDRCS